MDDGGDEKELGGCLAAVIIGVFVLILGGAVGCYLIYFLENSPGFHI